MSHVKRHVFSSQNRNSAQATKNRQTSNDTCEQSDIDVFLWEKTICSLIVSSASLNSDVNIWNISEGSFYLQYVNCILIDLAFPYEYYLQ